ncbi:MAG: methylmalonyl-CoA epimerase [Gaiellaceae bacterium]
MAVEGINHVGLAVEDLDEAVATYERLFGAEVERRAEGDGLRGAMMRVGGGRVELLTSSDAETPIGKFLAKRGPGMHHIAYSVDDIRGELAALAGHGVELIDAEPRVGLFGHEIAFAQPDSVHGVLTELVGR